MPEYKDPMDDADEPKDPIEIPLESLSAAALRGVVESFVLREGTDYGEQEVPLARKIAQVTLQLERREAKLIFDPNTETVDIIPAGRDKK